MRLFRLTKIVTVGLRFGLDRMILDADSSGRLARIWQRVFFWRTFSEPRAVRLRKALESLGPIFVKFGQMLSTRRDLLPPDLADELALLQDRVPPFPTAQALDLLEGFYGKPIDEVFRDFERTPVASASRHAPPWQVLQPISVDTAATALVAARVVPAASTAVTAKTG